MPFIDVSEAARRLGVNAQRVRALANQGRLPAHKLGSRWLIDAERLDVRAEGRRDRGRPYSQEHALGALFLASRDPAPWLSPYESWRLERYALPRLKALVGRLHARAKVAYLVAPESAIKRIGDDPDVVRSGVSAAEHYGADVYAPGVLDVYCIADRVSALVRRYALREAAERSANLILRSVSHGAALKGRRFMPKAVVAVDLVDSSDGRTRRAGLKLLSALP